MAKKRKKRARQKKPLAASGGPSKIDGLSARQQTFVHEYLIDPNATEAYRRAGYKPKSERSAEAAASRLLSNVIISERIKEAIKKRADAAGLTVDRIWEEWRRIGLADIGDIIDFSGVEARLRPASEITEDARRAIASVKVRRYVDGKGDDARLSIAALQRETWHAAGRCQGAGVVQG